MKELKWSKQTLLYGYRSAIFLNIGDGMRALYTWLRPCCWMHNIRRTDACWDMLREKPAGSLCHASFASKHFTMERYALCTLFVCSHGNIRRSKSCSAISDQIITKPTGLWLSDLYGSNTKLCLRFCLFIGTENCSVHG